MFITECLNKQSKLMEDYVEGNHPLRTFFDYNYRDDFQYKDRYKELMSRTFHREALVEHLLVFNRKYQCSEQTIENIEKLVDHRSVVVVGGQQAGVLTGPLYTIHKITSILKLAKKQEALLGVPVIPLFWIAGEDHDFDEVNHVYTVSEQKLQKRKVHQYNNDKKAVADMWIDKEALKAFIYEVFRDNKETKHTKNVLVELDEMLNSSITYIDLFSFLIHRLFQHTGIVLLNSHDGELRKIETPFLKQLVSENKHVNKAFLEQANTLQQAGYGEPIELVENNTHLFYHLNGSRLLLERTANEMFTVKQQHKLYTQANLMEMVENEPENFSNNVVTRPLMQEFLLPVLAFVAGPGEVAYWAALKNVFHLFSFKMPPVVPRLSITLVESQFEQWLNKHQETVLQVIEKRVIKGKETLAFWSEKKEIEKTLQNVIQEVEKAHLPLKQLATQYDQGLEKLATKNHFILTKELTFLANKIEKSVRQKYEHEWKQFDLIEANLIPNGGLQERSLNIFKYVNDYGFDFVSELLNFSYEFNDTHKVVFLD